MEDLNKVDDTPTQEQTEETTPAADATEAPAQANGPQLGKQLNKRPKKGQPAAQASEPAAEEESAADPAPAPNVEQTAPTTAPQLSQSALAIKTALQFGRPKEEDRPGKRATATSTRTEATLAAETIAGRHQHPEQKAEALTAEGKMYGKLAKESALKAEAYLRERAQELAIEKRTHTPTEIQQAIELAMNRHQRQLKLAEDSPDAVIRAEILDKAQRELSADLLKASDNAHPEYMITSIGPNGEVARKPVKTALGDTARQALLILAVAPPEKIDEIIRESRRGNGADSRKAFYDPKGFGATSPLLTGGDELVMSYDIIQGLTYDRKGETIERIRFAQLTADYALAGDWNGAGRCVDVLTGKAPVKKGNVEVLTFPKDTPIELVYHMVQAAVWKGHALACRAEADRIRKENDQKKKRDGLSLANPQPDETRRKTEEARKGQKTEPTPEATPAPTDEERADAQRKEAIHNAKIELAHITKNHDPKDPWPKDKIRALCLSIARHHPDYADKASRRKIMERNPNTDDKTALTAEQFTGFAIAMGRELLNVDANMKPETTTA
jgi:hypothetical protein